MYAWRVDPAAKFTNVAHRVRGHVEWGRTRMWCVTSCSILFALLYLLVAYVPVHNNGLDVGMREIQFLESRSAVK